MNYTYESLNQIYDETMSQMERKAPISQLNVLTGMAAGYAIDAIDIGRKNGTDIKLDRINEDDLISLIMLIYYNLKGQGISNTEISQRISKEIGALMTFVFCNVLKTVENAKIVAEGNRLVVIALKDDGEVRAKLDIADKIERFVSENVIHGKGDDTMVIAHPEGVLKEVMDEIEAMYGDD